MVQHGLTHSHLGNVSQRVGDQMLISTRGCCLDELEDHLITIPIYTSSDLEDLASSELRVHREIYQRTSASAILHGHPSFSVIISLLCSERRIVPYDSEGKYLLQEIPIVTGEPGSEELAVRTVEALQKYRGVIAKGQGSLATGSTVKEAYAVLSAMEHSCRVKYYVEQFGGNASAREYLWAPWRIQYIRTEKPHGCFLCEKAAENQDEDNYILYRGKRNFILLNAYPYNPGHLIVAPYSHVGELEELSEEERHEHIDLVAMVVVALKEVFRPSGFNLGANLGGVAGAGVKDHIHTHIVPRWEGDTNYMPVLADVRIVPEALADTYRKLKAAFPCLI